MSAEGYHVSLRKVRFSDTDCTGRVFFPRYVEWIDEAVDDYLASRGFVFDERGGMTVNGSRVDWTLVTGEYWCRMLKPLRLNDRLLIRIWVERVGRSSLTFGGEVLRDGEVVAVARITYVSVSTSSLRSVPVPEDLRKVLAELVREGSSQSETISQANRSEGQE
ncbi:MAG: thioesterase family protein [Nitrososphaerota archaeon]|nr:acyl-CoA thioesterase [Candidatus Calditenuis fumarioli]